MSWTNAVGRRKAAVARVFMKPGSGQIIVNKRSYTDYFSVPVHQLALTEPLRILGVDQTYDLKINVNGGGIKGQAEAIRLGIARALVKDNEENKATLKAEKKDMFTRDARVVERKKPGLRKARKRSQFSKR